jgi:hypothetical protein
MIDDTPWDRRVRFARDRSGHTFAYRPGELITTAAGVAALNALLDAGWKRERIEPVTDETPARSPDEQLRDERLRKQRDAEKERGGEPAPERPATPAAERAPFEPETVIIGGRLRLVRNVPDPVGTARLLRARGISAQVNHVAFAAAVPAGSGPTAYATSNGIGSPAAQWASNGIGSPAAWWASNGIGSPAAWWASNGIGSPAAQWASNGIGSPAAWWASNGIGSPWGGAGGPCCPVPVPCACGADDCSTVPAQQHGPSQSSVLPAPKPAPDQPPGRLPDGLGAKRVLVLDTGRVGSAAFAPETVAILQPVIPDGEDVDDADGDDNGLIDYAAGHGTFIAGIYRRLAPMAEVTVVRVMQSAGDVDDATVAQALAERFALDADTPPDEVPYHLLSMSFTGYTEEDDPPFALAEVLDEIQHRYPDSVAVVASAGNDASCRLTWPAGLEGVVGVGGLGSDGRPAPFTNYGTYVRACAPATGIVSTFYNYNADTMTDAPERLKEFTGWARWDGTSFAAPIVGAELLWESATSKRTMSNAVRRRIDDPELFRLPYLGTVVNLR